MKRSSYHYVLKVCLLCFLILPFDVFAIQITLADIYEDYKFMPKGMHGLNSMNDGIHYTLLENNRVISMHRYETGEKVKTVLDLNDHEAFDLSIYDYTFSPDESMILLETSIEPIYRHSYAASYYIYDRGTNQITKLSDGGKQKLATFSPDNKKIAYVRNNNLFLYYIDAQKEEQITFDGKRNHIINGEPDWVYEEEFGFSKGFCWSPAGDQIAFYKMDERHVKQFNMTYYSGLYPQWYKYKYPKAGEENAYVSIHVYHLETGETVMMDTGPEKDQYIPRIKWTKENNSLCIYRLNRLQNNLELLLADSHTGKHIILYTEHSDTYISEAGDDHTHFLENQKEFIILSEKNGYRHLYLYSTEGELIRQLTKGMWDVMAFIGYDPEEEMVYYSSHEESSLEKHIYAVSKDLDLKKKISVDPGYNSIHFSAGFKYHIISNSRANQPNTFTLYDKSGKKMKILEDNRDLKDRIKEYRFPAKEFIRVPTENNIQLNGYMIKPLDFDSTASYPLLVYTYGGPESQKVIDSWESTYYPWFSMLAQKGYIVVCVDNRGTDGRGEAFRKSTYLQLGKLETIDQINVARYFSEKTYIDSERIGIFGWSYGGYLTALCMIKGSAYFSTGIAVAPISNWRFYDTIYTERFLRTPQENPDGYEDNSPINFVDQLEGNLLLIHGSADDNVHLQNTIELSIALRDANKQFDMHIYANKNHNINGENTQLHLFTKITDYLLNHL